MDAGLRAFWRVGVHELVGMAQEISLCVDVCASVCVHVCASVCVCVCVCVCV